VSDEKSMINILKEYFDRMKDKSYLTNEWLNNGEMKIYVRKSVRCIDSRKLIAFDIVSVEVRNKGKGYFTKFLNEAHNLNPWNITYIENVFFTRFQRFFEKNGYIKIGNLIPCYYKETK
jgi:N-acetylglutamate synthase-like GNAT family acetyltransferase